MPLRPRPRPPIIASALAPDATEATCVLTNVTDGVPELQPGTVKYLRIGEPVAWPYDNEIGGQRYEPDAKATGVNWTPVRILGTVPVEADGSACFRVPADTALYFQALDEQGRELRRMRSYVSFQAGETRGCAGCHETRGAAPRLPRGMPLALRRPPSRPTPPPWGDRPLSVLRDIQPVLTRHCLGCHSGLKPAGSLDLSPGLTAGNNRAYDSLIAAGLLALSSKGEDARITDVKAVGSHRSRLVEVLRTTHRERCRLSDEDWRRLYTWIDANGVYHDGFIRKRPEGAAGYSLPEDQELWRQVVAVHGRRCASCHGETNLARPEWVDLQQPERSLFIAAPLGQATPSGRKCSPAAYVNTQDPDCAQVLALVTAAVRRAWDQPRRDLRCLASAR
jgi:mono/diheme cytochrome c family protein